jgi:hypothetical protein
MSQAYIAALEARFQVPMELLDGRVFLQFEGERWLDISFGETSATLATALPRAHDGLPSAVLIQLLRFNLDGIGIAARRCAAAAGRIISRSPACCLTGPSRRKTVPTWRHASSKPVAAPMF